MAIDKERLLAIGLGKLKTKRTKAPEPVASKVEPDEPDDDEDDYEYGVDGHDEDEADEDGGPDDGGSEDSDSEDKGDDSLTPEQVHCAQDAIDAFHAGDAHRLAEAILAIVGR